jgi:argininosuccinate synthase
MREMYQLSVASEDAPNELEYVDLTFAENNCVNVGQASGLRPSGPQAWTLTPLQVLQTPSNLGGKHGTGHVATEKC